MVSFASHSRTATWPDVMPDKEPLGQIVQAELLAQTPERHEGDDIGEMLGSVQQPQAALGELHGPPPRHRTGPCAQAAPKSLTPTQLTTAFDTAPNPRQ